MALTTPTPQERLVSSRLAIVRHMRHDAPTDQEAALHADAADDEGRTKIDGTWSVMKQALATWWHHHPAHMAMDVAKPMLGSYAKSHPVKLMGIAAGVGALAVVLKPWRLVSLGGLLIAAIKSSDLSGAALSMLFKSDPSAQKSDQPDNETETR